MKKTMRTAAWVCVLLATLACCFAVVRHASGIVSSLKTVDRPLSPVDIRGESIAGRSIRPSGCVFWSAYKPVNFADYNAGSNLPHVWGVIGGSLGATGIQERWSPCAAELSYALNHSGNPVPSIPHVSNRNTDKQRYILSARLMRRYLWRCWGRPDYPNYGVFLKDPGSSEFLDGLRLGGGVAVFATDGHVGVIKAGYRDPILPSQGTADIWKLPG